MAASQLYDEQQLKHDHGGECQSAVAQPGYQTIFGSQVTPENSIQPQKLSDLSKALSSASDSDDSEDQHAGSNYHRGNVQLEDKVKSKSKLSSKLSSAIKRSVWSPNAIFTKKRGFTHWCMALYQKFKELHREYDESIIPAHIWDDLKHIKAKLTQEKKDICIGVFGQHNCGKSTFVNALIGDVFLPVRLMNETAVRVEVQHEDNVHPGPCSSECQQQLTKYCPRLFEYGQTKAIGCSSICEYLKRKNTETRQKLAISTFPCTQEAASLVLQVSMPMLDRGVPLDWKVNLVDNPGFGETRECITHLAGASMITSSAYIYLVQMENIDGTEAANFFTELVKIDRAAICDGRLIVGITKFDKIYEDDEQITEEVVKQKIVQSVEAATSICLPEDVIIPLCGKWALKDYKLVHQLNNVRDDNISLSVLQRVIVALERYHVPLPAGQGQRQEEAIARLGHKGLVDKLEKASGIFSMKARIQDVVGKACIITWSKKIYTQLVNYVQDTGRRIDSMCGEVSDKRDEKDRVFKDLTGLHEEIKNIRKDMEASAATGRTLKSTTAWKNLQKSYCSDVKVSESPSLGKERTMYLIGEFRRKCKEKFEAGELSSSDFEIGIQEFLIECQPKLQRVFNNCSFHNMEASLAHLNEQSIRCLASLKQKAERLIGVECSSFLTSLEEPEKFEANKFSDNSKLLTSKKFICGIQNQLIKVDLAETSCRVDEHKVVCSQDLQERQSECSAATDIEHNTVCSQDLQEGQSECSAAREVEHKIVCSQDIQEGQSRSSVAKEVTNLGHLSLTGSVPSVSLPWWRKIVIFLRKLIGVKSDPGDSEQHDDDSESALSDAAVALQFNSAVLKSYVVIDVQKLLNNTLPCVEQSITNHRPLEQPSSVTSPASNDDVTAADDLSIAATSPTSSTWRDERLLNETIDYVQRLMEEECDQYFERIETEAIKHFYDKYCSKIRDCLQKFDDEFKDQLAEKAYQLQQLKRETDILDKKIKALNKSKEELLKLEKQLCKAWDKMGLMLEEAAHKRAQEREDRKTVVKEIQSLF